MADQITADDVRRACQLMDFDRGTTDELIARLPVATAAADGPDVAAERAAREAEMMTLLKCASADKLLHDLRNVLNELSLLKATMDL